MEGPEEKSFLKINFSVSPSDELMKRISFPNSEIKRIAFKEKPGFFYRFQFETCFDYLGKKERVTNAVYIFNGKPIRGDLSEYSVTEGNEKEVKLPDYKNDYFIAKEELKKLVQGKTNEISRMLKNYLEKEKEKIEESFVSETKRFRNDLNSIAEKLMEFSKSGDIEKIREQKKLINSLREKMNFDEIEKDKTRALQLENQKHLLNIENKLVKMTIIYYPVYVFSLDIFKGNIKKSFTVQYDPISETVLGLACESCSDEIKEVVICNSGHAVCKYCTRVCDSCKKEFCKKCLRNSCDICSKKICKDCSVRCFRCSRVVCKDHARQDKLSGYFYCRDCSKRCDKCGDFKDPFTFKVSKRNNKEICEDCFREETRESIVGGIFE
jgi:hypothetical protein